MAFINILYNLWPNGDERMPNLRDGIAINASSVFSKYGISSPLLVAHVMAQISHECGAGHDIVENLNYSAERLIEVWPRHFNSQNANSFAHNPQKLANFIYNPPQHTDLGNRANSDDGWTYRGRGASQTTGRDGYTRLAAKVGLDLVNHPDLVNDPSHFLECGVADFILCGCLPFAKTDDIVGVTKHLNGGTVGLDQRIAWLAKWKAALGTWQVDFTIPATLTLPGSPPIAPEIPRPPEITLPPPGQVKPGLAPTFWGRVLDLFKPKGD